MRNLYMLKAVTAVVFACVVLFTFKETYADPVSEALEEAKKTPSAAITENNPADGMLKNEIKADPKSMTTEQQVPEAGEKGKQTMTGQGDMSELHNSSTSDADTDLSLPDQNNYPGVINRVYKSGGNGEPAIFIYYPEFGVPGVDQVFKSFAETTAQSFEGFTGEPEATGEEDTSSSSQMELTGSFTLEKPNPDIASVTFNIYDYTGGAHGQLRVIVYNYDLKNASQLQFGSLFNNPQMALQILSELSAEKLRASLGEDIEEDMLKEGTQPLEDNFSCISLLPDGVLVEFQPYQVGPWSIGQPHVKITLEELRAAGPNPEIWKNLNSSQ